MESFNFIKSVLNKYTKEELKSLISSLDIGKRNKSTKLINYILENKTSNEVFDNLYNESNYLAFNKIINRLRNRVLDNLLIDKNISADVYSKRNQLIFKLKKRLIQAEILHFRGCSAEAKTIYDSVIKKSNELEAYDIYIQALYSKSRLVNIHGKPKLIYKIQEEILSAESRYKIFNESQNLFNSILNTLSRSSYNDRIDSLNSVIETINKNANFLKSKILNYYYLTLLTEKYQILGNYEMSHNTLFEIKNLLTLYPHVYTPNRYGSVLLNIANNYLFLNCYELSISYSNKSKKYFLNNDFSLAIVDEVIFLAHLYNGDIVSANLILDNLLTIKKDSVTSYFLSKLKYYKACILFLQGEHHKSISMLSTQHEIDQDKEGWNLCRRILTIMNYIELNDYAFIDGEVQNLEKFIKRLSKSQKVNKRYYYILLVLNKLINSNLNYELLARKKGKIISKLSSNSIDFGWKIRSPEIIDFHYWLSSKLKPNSAQI